MTRVGYLGIDLGGTGAKAAVYDLRGVALGCGHATFAPTHTSDGRAETAIEEIMAAARAATGEAIAQSGATIRAASVSSQGQTFVALDEADRPLHPVIMWYDCRAAQEAAQLRAALARVPAARRLEIEAIATAPKIMWLHAHAGVPPARRYLLLPDYLAYHLTRQAVTDINTASSTGLFWDDAEGYCQEALDAAGIRETQLSEIRRPGTVIGRVRAERAREWGLSPETVLVTGTNDQYAGALGAGNTHPGLVSETTGSCLALVALTERLPDPLPPGMFGGRFPIPQYQFALAFAKTAGLALEWFARECGAGASLADLNAHAAAVPIGSRGVTVLPHFDGAISPHPDARARGHICNLTLGHTRADLYRALLESISFSLRENLEMLQRAGFAIASIRSIGGGAKSDLWLRMKADVSGHIVERPAVMEASTLGAALLAAVGVGAFASLEEAAAAAVRIDAVFTPAAQATQEYQGPYEQYLRLSRTLYHVADGGC